MQANVCTQTVWYGDKSYKRWLIGGLNLDRWRVINIMLLVIATAIPFCDTLEKNSGYVSPPGEGFYLS